MNTLGNATYSPEDNKLRFYPDTRLSKEDYLCIKEAGFGWAPKQELFVAPMWTPSREDLMIEWCGEIGDEDKSLVERAEERAERFDDYSDKRKSDAESAHTAVSAIADNIPLGQPILVGHHSEKRARKDAERIESGMRRAVKMWETSKYWQDRAKGAIRSAKYKELPSVRARRIKRLEADKRKQERNKAEAEKALRFWNGELKLKNTTTGETRPFEITEANRQAICDYCGRSEMGYLPAAKHPTLDQYWHAWDVLRPDDERYKDCPSMSVSDIQAIARKHYPELISHYSRWLAHYENRLTYERAMLDEQGGIASDQTAPEKGGACRCWASPNAGWSYIQKVNKVSVTVLDNWGNGGENFTRNIPFDKCFSLMTAAQVEAATQAGRLIQSPDKTGFYLSGETAPGAIKTSEPYQKPEPTKFDAMKSTLKAGVQVVSAPQLFPTPPDLAKQMVEIAFENGWGVQVCAEMNERCRILEPSAGTGSIVRAIQAANQTRRASSCEVHAVEINVSLANSLKDLLGDDVVCADFLTCNGDLGKFDRIIMNPPFADGADIKHIQHAITLLNPGGRLVAICANGPRQRDKIMPLATLWTDLPQGTFKEQGTNVNTALLVIDA